jgi:hypothetical protein
MRTADGVCSAVSSGASDGRASLASFREGTVAAHTAEKEQHCEGKEVGGRDVEQRLSRAQHLEVVQERKHFLDRAEGAGLLELREDLGVLGLGKEAGVGKRGEDAQLLDALQEPHRRLLRTAAGSANAR